MGNKVKYYQIGVEILDRNTKRPIEHRECEKEYDLERALDTYIGFKLSNNEQKYLDAYLTNGDIMTLKYEKRAKKSKVMCEPLDLESVTGFVIDLSTTENVYRELEGVLHDLTERTEMIAEYTIPELREFILEYYLMNYYDGTIIVKDLNVYQIVEEDLYVRSEK